METVTLYREIGKTLHSLGAFRVVLLNSKATPEQNVVMSLEISACWSDKFQVVEIKKLEIVEVVILST